jgi:hypothetical protein
MAGQNVTNSGLAGSVSTTRRRIRRRTTRRATTGLAASTAGGGVTPTTSNLGMTADQRKFYELGQKSVCDLHGIPFRTTR